MILYDKRMTIRDNIYNMIIYDNTMIRQCTIVYNNIQQYVTIYDTI